MSIQRHIHDKPGDELRRDFYRALQSMDTAWGQRMFPGAPPAEVEAAMHKARYHSAAMPMTLRNESAKWLRERGLKDALGQEVIVGRKMQ